jgi:hypothetical protein
MVAKKTGQMCSGIKTTEEREETKTETETK